MYILIRSIFILIGVILIFLPHFIYQMVKVDSKPSRVFLIITRLIGIVFLFAGLMGVYYIISGKIILPLN